LSTRAFIAVGSNIDPERNIEAAIELMARELRLVGVSTFYRTAALGPPGQPDFLNGVVAVETELEPRQLKRSLLERIESELGRTRTEDKYAPRSIDLDLVLYGDLTSSDEGLVLPDPEIPERAFLALPLLELEPDLVLPGTGRPLRELAGPLSSLELEPERSLSERLRRVQRARRDDG
jgi:2-amino-4-hydroxy-6-hydroxymethyldihydropteridine diphosphokinase